MVESLYFIWCPSLPFYSERYKTIVEAKKEARKLCQQPENNYREFFILRVIESIQYRTDPFVIKNYRKDAEETNIF